MRPIVVADDFGALLLCGDCDEVLFWVAEEVSLKLLNDVAATHACPGQVDA